MADAEQRDVTASAITVEPAYTQDDFAGADEEILAAELRITPERVAVHVGCARELARQSLAETGLDIAKYER